MRSQNHRSGGMTLIEVMMAVAIIGILAAVAIPSFMSYQNRSKRSEAMTNLSAIAKTEIAYFGTAGVYVRADAMPAGSLTVKKQWDAAARAEYGPLGYAPEGAVWYQYEVNNWDACGCAPAPNGEFLCFTAAAHGDLDGDLSVATIAYFHADTAPQACPTAFAGPFVPDPVDPVLHQPIVIPIAAGSDDF